MRKSSTRTQRSKGIKATHALQFCVLLGVCIWLIYQVKYSHDKKKEFYEKDVESSTVSQRKDGTMKLGRKDLPNVQEEVTKNEVHEEEEEEEIVGEEENKHEEDDEKGRETEKEAVNEHHDKEEKEASKHDKEEQEEEEGEGNKKEEENELDEVENKNGEEREIEDDDAQGGGGDDEIDERDQDKMQEIDREDEFLEEDKVREGDDGEKEIESNRREDEVGWIENNNNNHDEGDKYTHEAREEHYKADDASSAVSHESQVVETGEESLETSDRNAETITLDQGNKSINSEEIYREQKSSVLKLGEVEGGNSINMTNPEEKAHERKSYNYDVRKATEYADRSDASNITTKLSAETDNNNSTVVSLETSGSVQNGTESLTETSTQTHNKTEAAETPPEAANLQYIKLEEPRDTNSEDSDSTAKISANTKISHSIETESSNSTSESALPKKITNPNSKSEGKNNPSLHLQKNVESSTVGSDGDDESGNTKENSSISSTNEILDAVENDPVDTTDTTIPHEEKEAFTDPDTLPVIRTEGDDNEESAAD